MYKYKDWYIEKYYDLWLWIHNKVSIIIDNDNNNFELYKNKTDIDTSNLQIINEGEEIKNTELLKVLKYFNIDSIPIKITSKDKCKSVKYYDIVTYFESNGYIIKDVEKMINELNFETSFDIEPEKLFKPDIIKKYCYNYDQYQIKDYQAENNYSLNNIVDDNINLGLLQYLIDKYCVNRCDNNFIVTDKKILLYSGLEKSESEEAYYNAYSELDKSNRIIDFCVSKTGDFKSLANLDVCPLNIFNPKALYLGDNDDYLQEEQFIVRMTIAQVLQSTTLDIGLKKLLKPNSTFRTKLIEREHSILLSDGSIEFMGDIKSNDILQALVDMTKYRERV